MNRLHHILKNKTCYFLKFDFPTYEHDNHAGQMNYDITRINSTRLKRNGRHVVTLHALSAFYHSKDSLD